MVAATTGSGSREPSRVVLQKAFFEHPPDVLQHWGFSMNRGPKIDPNALYDPFHDKDSQKGASMFLGNPRYSYAILLGLAKPLPLSSRPHRCFADNTPDPSRALTVCRQVNGFSQVGW